MTNSTNSAICSTLVSLSFFIPVAGFLSYHITTWKFHDHYIFLTATGCMELQDTINDR